MNKNVRNAASLYRCMLATGINETNRKAIALGFSAFTELERLKGYDFAKSFIGAYTIIPPKLKRYIENKESKKGELNERSD